jgi:GTP-binding protein
MEFMEWMGTQQIPFSIIFTKADKLSEKKIDQVVSTYLKTMLEGVWAETPPHFITSATSSQGKEAVLAYVGSLL